MTPSHTRRKRRTGSGPAQIGSCVDDPPGTQCGLEPLSFIFRVTPLPPAAPLPVSYLAPAHPSPGFSSRPSEKRRAARFPGSRVHGLACAVGVSRLHQKRDNRHSHAPSMTPLPSPHHSSVPPPLPSLSVSRLPARSSQPHIPHPGHSAPARHQSLQPLRHCRTEVPLRRAAAFQTRHTHKSTCPARGSLQRGLGPLALRFPGARPQHLAPSGSAMLQDVASLSPLSDSRRIDR